MNADSVEQFSNSCALDGAEVHAAYERQNGSDFGDDFGADADDDEDDDDDDNDSRTTLLTRRDDSAITTTTTLAMMTMTTTIKIMAHTMS